jgi:flagellar motor protein MotB
VIKQASLSIAVATTLFMTGCGGEVAKMAESTALDMKAELQNKMINEGTEAVLTEIAKFIDGETKEVITDETARADAIAAIQDSLREPIRDRVSEIVKGTEDVSKIDVVQMAIDILEALKPEILEMIKEYLPEEEPEPEPTIEEIQEIVLPAESIEAINGITMRKGELPSISSSAKEALSGLADFLKSNEGYKVSFKAYTDASGSNAYNLELSQKRAGFLAEYLISFGVSESQVEAIGFGETEFIDPANPYSDKNRRIVVELSER